METKDTLCSTIPISNQTEEESILLMFVQLSVITSKELTFQQIILECLKFTMVCFHYFFKLLFLKPQKKKLDDLAYETLALQQNVAQLLSTSKQRGVLSSAHASKGKEILDISVDPIADARPEFNQTFFKVKREAEDLKHSLYSLINPPWAKFVHSFSLFQFRFVNFLHFQQNALPFHHFHRHDCSYGCSIHSETGRLSFGHQFCIGSCRHWIHHHDVFGTFHQCSLLLGYLERSFRQ